MCFYIHPKHDKPKVAKRDIVCYKIGFRFPDNVFVPYYMVTYEYVLGKRKPEVVLIREKNDDVIDIGYHSYTRQEELVRWKRGYHTDRFCAVKCIIPKGTTYYYNPDFKEYVSSTIVVQEFLDWKKIGSRSK